MMFEAPHNQYLVPFDGSFRVAHAHSAPPADTPKEKTLEKALAEAVNRLSDLQQVLYADNSYAVLLVFQALDAAGKDSTIRAVLTGVNPSGCQVVAFKQPSHIELDHDFLWRTSRALPQRGRIGVFNRSYYEEVLVVRVHQELLDAQRLPATCRNERLWEERLESICAHELHLARNGVVVLKFWLNVSRDEQRKRFLARLDEPHKNWKFAPGDVEERRYWPQYMEAYQAALAATSRSWAPWYAVPADDKPYMRATVAGIVVTAIEQLGLRYPRPPRADARTFEEMRRQLEAEQ
jgi:PPK2 family polyphosphate:nucleotide phosphotransferase